MFLICSLSPCCLGSHFRSLVKYIYKLIIEWANPLLGRGHRLSYRLGPSAAACTPRVFKKFNYRIIWADGSKGPAKLCVENYGHGSDARYNSWAILSSSIPAV